MAAITGLVAVAFISLGQTFSEGVSAYHQKDFDRAIQSFSDVMERSESDSPFVAFSLLWRAECLALTADNARAQTDLDRLLEGELDASTRRDAQALFLKVSGSVWDGVLLSSPEISWESVVLSVKARKNTRLAKCLTGQLLEQVTANTEKGDSWAELDKLVNLELSDIDYSEARKEATITLRNALNDSIYLRALKESNAWRFAGPGVDPDEQRPVAVQVPEHHETESALRTDTYRMRVLGKAVEKHLLATGHAPTVLTDLKPYATDYEGVCKSVSNGDFFILRTPTRGLDARPHPWIFNSSPVEGKRTVWAFSAIREVPEEEFLEIARKYGLGVGLGTESDTPEVLLKEIRKWIGELGNDSYEVRQNAYQQLEAAGESAVPALRDTRADDPEVLHQIQQLLSAF